MLDVLLAALICSVMTVSVIYGLVLVVFFIDYVVDNWQYASGWFKAAGLFLIIFVSWVLVISTCKYTHQKAERCSQDTSVRL